MAKAAPKIDSQFQTVCVRCGKDRIEGKTWTQKSENGNVMTHTKYVCPDPACQKIVDAEFKEKLEKRLAMEERRNSPTQA